MGIWIALIRGINVGGRNRLSMRELSRLFSESGCSDVTTYIQSGNVLFRARIDSPNAFADVISAEIESRHAFRPAVYVINANKLRKVIASNPYPEAESEPRFLHVFFLQDSPPKARIDAARRLTSATEALTVVGKALYLHAPKGIGRSKFVANIENVLCTRATSRNWQTITRLAKLASSMD